MLSTTRFVSTFVAISLAASAGQASATYYNKAEVDDYCNKVLGFCQANSPNKVYATVNECTDEAKKMLKGEQTSTRDTINCRINIINSLNSNSDGATKEAACTKLKDGSQECSSTPTYKDFCIDQAEACKDYKAETGWADAAACDSDATLYLIPKQSTYVAEGDTEFNTLGCRIYQAKLAHETPATYCNYLGKATTQAGGGCWKTPGKDTFCEDMMQTCDGNLGYDDNNACTTAFNSAGADGTWGKNAESANTRACRGYHLGLAHDAKATHCPHAKGDSLCVDPAAEESSSASSLAATISVFLASLFTYLAIFF